MVWTRRILLQSSCDLSEAAYRFRGVYAFFMRSSSSSDALKVLLEQAAN